MGTFIEVAESGADGSRIALRQDGVFLWRRRLLPLATVARVIPERRLLVLTVDKRALAGTEQSRATAAFDTTEPTEALGDEWRSRLESYVVSGGRQHEEAHDRPASPARAVPREEVRHLQFVSTANGYVLVERDGPPPPLGADVYPPEFTGPFVVTKLAPSPLPQDLRICAYLEPAG